MKKIEKELFDKLQTHLRQFSTNVGKYNYLVDEALSYSPWTYADARDHRNVFIYAFRKLTNIRKADDYNYIDLSVFHDCYDPKIDFRLDWYIKPSQMIMFQIASGWQKYINMLVLLAYLYVLRGRDFDDDSTVTDYNHDADLLAIQHFCNYYVYDKCKRVAFTPANRSNVKSLIINSLRTEGSDFARKWARKISPNYASGRNLRHRLTPALREKALFSTRDRFSSYIASVIPHASDRSIRNIVNVCNTMINGKEFCNTLTYNRLQNKIYHCKYNNSPLDFRGDHIIYHRFPEVSQEQWKAGDIDDIVKTIRDARSISTVDILNNIHVQIYNFLYNENYTNRVNSAKKIATQNV